MSTFVTTEKLSRLMDAVKAKIATKLDATGIKNDVLTTDAGYVLDARIGKTLGDRTTSLETKVSDLYFATDSNGKWGYKATKNGAVTPFRNPTGDATAAEVLSGKTFSSATLENATGTMANNGAWTGATTGEGSITIPAGYHNGSGSVSGKTSYNDGYAKGKEYVTANPGEFGLKRVVKLTLASDLTCDVRSYIGDAASTVNSANFLPVATLGFAEAYMNQGDYGATFTTVTTTPTVNYSYPTVSVTGLGATNFISAGSANVRISVDLYCIY